METSRETLPKGPIDKDNAVVAISDFFGISDWDVIDVLGHIHPKAGFLIHAENETHVMVSSVKGEFRSFILINDEKEGLRRVDALSIRPGSACADPYSDMLRE
jgi:hypothetical protein